MALTLDEKYMKEAIKQAKKAAAIDEVPIGCVIVYEGKYCTLNQGIGEREWLEAVEESLDIVTRKQARSSVRW